MKSVKVTAVPSLFAMLLALPLAACAAEVTPNEPDPTAGHTATGPGQGPAGAPENARAVGTSVLHRGSDMTPGKPEPIPNPWKGGPDESLPYGILPQVDNPIADLPSPRPILHKTVDDQDVEKYHGPAGDHQAY